MSYMSRFVSSFISLMRACFAVSPNSMCPPGITYFPYHLCDFIRNSLFSGLNISAPTVGSGNFCSDILFIYFSCVLKGFIGAASNL